MLGCSPCLARLADLLIDDHEIGKAKPGASGVIGLKGGNRFLGSPRVAIRFHPGHLSLRRPRLAGLARSIANAFPDDLAPGLSRERNGGGGGDGQAGATGERDPAGFLLWPRGPLMRVDRDRAFAMGWKLGAVIIGLGVLYGASQGILYDASQNETHRSALISVGS